MPFFVVSFMAIRRLCEVRDGEVSRGGLWWFTDLTSPDPFCLLSVISVSINLFNLEMGAEQAQKQRSSKTLKNIMRGVMLFFALVSTQFPAGLLIYWTGTAAYSTLFTAAMRQPAMRRMFNIPIIDADTGAKEPDSTGAAAAQAGPFIPTKISPVPPPPAKKSGRR